MNGNIVNGMATAGAAGAGTYNGAVISINDIQRIRSQIATLDRAIETYVGDLTTIINSFSNKEIVESFFKSGNFGEETKMKLEKVKGAISSYKLSINGVVSSTNKFLNVQEELNNKGRG